MRKLVVAALCASTFGVFAQDTATVPKHLQLAREFVANIKQENNEYVNYRAYDRMPGDSLLTTEYVIRTDCSGFVESMLSRANSGVLEQMTTKKFKSRHSIHDYYPSIEKSEAFERLLKVTDLKPGDVVMWLYADRTGHTLDGHILFVDAEPVKIRSRKPFAWGLTQYELQIIDTSQEAKSKDDTRYVTDPAIRAENLARGKEHGTYASPNYKGVGRGHIRLYADDTTGEIKGIAYNLDNAKLHAQDTDWNIVMGRPKLAPSAAN